jgi:mono/diheme cytochrome c family protein
MPCARTLFAVVALTGAYLTAGSSVQLRVVAAGLELQSKPVPPKNSVPENNALPLTSIPRKNPIPTSEASIKAGRAVYAKICRACHGLQGKGDGISAPPGSKPANLVRGEWKYGGSDAEIFKTIKGGVKPFDVMEPWGKKISDTDIWNTVNFLRDLAKHVKK